MSITTLMQTSPIISILIISLLVSIFSLLVTKFFTDQGKRKELRDKQKEKQALMKQHKDDKSKLMEIQKEMMALTMEMTKQSFALKPLIITFIPMVLVFAFIRSVYATTAIAGSWFWYYLVSVLIFSSIFRKVLNVY